MFSILRPARRAAPLAVALGIVLATSHLVAPCSAQPDEDALSAARAKFQQGTELEQAGNWAAALQRFREVGQVRMTPQVRYHIALCEEKLGKLVAALGGYKLALADADSVGPGFRAEVEEGIENLRTRIPSLTITRGEGAEAATIELDGVTLGASSIGEEFPIDPGPHTVRATAPDHEPFARTITLGEGEAETLVVELQANPEPGDSPAAEDGPGPAVIPREEGLVLDRDFWMYASYGAGGAFLLGSGAAFFMRQQKLDDIEQICGATCDNQPLDVWTKAQAARDSARTYRIIGWTSLGLGVAGAGVGTYLLLTRTPERTAAGHPAWRFLMAAPNADLAGLSVTGDF